MSDTSKRLGQLFQAAMLETASGEIEATASYLDAYATAAEGNITLSGKALEHHIRACRKAAGYLGILARLYASEADKGGIDAPTQATGE